MNFGNSVRHLVHFDLSVALLSHFRIPTLKSRKFMFDIVYLSHCTIITPTQLNYTFYCTPNRKISLSVVCIVQEQKLQFRLYWISANQQGTLFALIYRWLFWPLLIYQPTSKFTFDNVYLFHCAIITPKPLNYAFYRTQNSNYRLMSCALGENKSKDFGYFEFRLTDKALSSLWPTSSSFVSLCHTNFEKLQIHVWRLFDVVYLPIRTPKPFYNNCTRVLSHTKPHNIMW